MTISTVGYGDQYPVTNEGRILGAGIIVIGVGIFGTFTGYLANLFLAPKPREGPEPVEVLDDRASGWTTFALLLAEQQAALERARRPPHRTQVDA